jgi:hypothetical protein
MKDKEVFEGEDINGNIVKFSVKTPGAEEIKKSQIVYNRAFKQALDDGALLRQKLTAYMREQKLWNDAKQKQYDDLLEQIGEMEESLQKGGIRLTTARQIALDLRGKREEFRSLIAERNSLDAASAEGQADNARFEELVRLCTINPENNQRYFSSESDYNESANQPWVVVAAEKLGNAMYGLDPNYEKNLEENKFLKEFKFVNDELRFINEDGHTVDSEGRLTNEDGRYIAYENDDDYKAKKNPYFVNKDGERVVEGKDGWIKESMKERQPFLDDEDNPIQLSAEAETEQKPKVTKKKTRKTKTDQESV